MYRGKAAAIPFIHVSRRMPPRREEEIYGALRSAFPALRDVHLKPEAGADFFGSNVQLRDCLISSGVHPAIRARSAEASGGQDATFLLAFSGQAEFSFGPGRKLSLAPMKAALIGSQDWRAETTDYGGIVLCMKQQTLAESLALATDGEATADDLSEFDLATDAGLGLRRCLASLQMMYRPELAASGLYDGHVLSTLALFIAQSRTTAARHPRDRMARLVEKARSQIRDNLKSAFTVAELSRSLGVSERHLQIAFQAVHGVSPKQWMLFEKLSAAKDEILANRSVRLTRLAEEYCFSSPAHFSSAFKKAFGVSPQGLKN